jgi:hypothetical protein
MRRSPPFNPFNNPFVYVLRFCEFRAKEFFKQPRLITSIATADNILRICNRASSEQTTVSGSRLLLEEGMGKTWQAKWPAIRVDEIAGSPPLWEK